MNKAELVTESEHSANKTSCIPNECETQKTLRPWGHYRVLDNKQTVKVKELVINPGCSLSDQKHFKRNEHWYVLQGTCSIDTEYQDVKQTNILKEHDTFIIGKTVWHRAYNTSNQPCYILEVQYGEECIEEDIERRD